MRVIFLVEFGLEVGLGHLSRCASFAQGLASFGHTTAVLFSSNTGRADVSSRFLGKFHERFEVSFPEFGDSKHLQEIESAFQTSHFDLAVVDSYRANLALVSKLGKLNAQVLQIADYPAQYPFDLVVDYGFDASVEKHHFLNGTDGKLFLGPQFAPVMGFDSGRIQKESESRYGFISLGASERSGALIRIGSKVLSAFPDLDLRILTQHRTEPLVRWAKESNRVALLDPGLEMHVAAQNADFAIVSSSVTMYEMAALGLPTIGLSFEDNQRFSQSTASPSQYLQMMPLETFLDQPRFPIAIGGDSRRDFDEQVSARVELQSMVDGFGPLRLAGLISPWQADEVSLREARASDVAITFRWANDPVARQESFARPLVSSSDHYMWFQQILNSRSKLFIAEIKGLPIGQARFTDTGESWLLSYSLDANFRGKGLAKVLVSKGLEHLGVGKCVDAEVSKNNVPSIRTLERVGFAHSGESTRGGIMMRLDTRKNSWRQA